MNAAIKLKSLSVTRERHLILDDISAEIVAGQVMGLLGPSGAGKTTLMRAIVGLQRVKPGSVTVLGQAAGSASLRSQIGYVTQEPSVYGDLTVRENLSYFAAMSGVPRDRIKTVLASVDLTAQGDQLARTLSGGQRSRASLAVALLDDPKLLVLDEPTVGVDPILRAQLWQQFRELAQAGITLLVSSHVMDEANHCDQLMLLRDGQLLAVGSPQELQSRTNTADIESAFIKLVGGTS